MQVNPEDGAPEIYVTWSDPRMTDFENRRGQRKLDFLNLYFEFWDKKYTFW